MYLNQCETTIIKIKNKNVDWRIFIICLINHNLFSNMLLTLLITTNLYEIWNIFDKYDFKCFIEKFNVDVKFEINNNASFKKRYLYKFWHRRFDYLNFKKFKNMHQITTLKRSIFIIKQINFCEICAIIKMINKRNRHLLERSLIYWQTCS